MAHLCLSIAQEFGDPDPAQRINLLSLACTIGDKNLLNLRLQKCSDSFKDSPHWSEQIDQVRKQISDNDELHFISEAGPCRKMTNKSQYNIK